MIFKNSAPEHITQNTFDLIGSDWMLITGGTINHNNCMTASWGGFGILWFKPVVFVFVRPQRYTHEFLQKNEFFTLSFFDETYRQQLQLCGSTSGREIDKKNECNLTAFETENKAIAYEQATMILECRTMYTHQLQTHSFIDKSPIQHYATGDFHIQYIAEITECLIK